VSTRTISKKRSAAALTMLLTGCTPERLASFTGASLAQAYNVTPQKAEDMLAKARQGRLV
jgi:hypothetical protein